MSVQTTQCPNCHAENFGFETTCRVCGKMLPPNYQNPMQPQPNAGMQGQQTSGADKKMPAGLLAIFLGGLGIHKFFLGYKNEGIIMLVVWLIGLFLCGIPSLIVSVVGIIEGIMYLTKSDQEFVQTYIVNKKPWF